MPVAVFASSEGGLGNLISIAPGSMLWTLLTFFILLIVLWKFAWGPIIKGLEAREEKIQGAIDQAQRDRKEAARLLREYEEKLKAASAEISDRINKADQDAAARIEQASLEARDKAEKLLDRAKRKSLRNVNEPLLNSEKKLLKLLRPSLKRPFRRALPGKITCASSSEKSSRWRIRRD